VLEWTSALPGLGLHGGHAGADGRRLLSLREVRGWSLTQVGMFAGQDEAVRAVISGQTGGEGLQAHNREAASAVVSAQTGGEGLQAHNRLVQAPPAQDEARVYKIAHDQYWVVSQDQSTPARLASAVPDDLGTVTSLSHARVQLTISGPPARATLEKLLPIDLRPDKFQVGEFRQTSMHHVGIFIERTASDTYRLFLLRTFALTLLEVLRDAALEFGYDEGVEEA
jgi:heterotetrameric sarcosine oxidase gamma subunit